ncbi:MAG: hypothetical protein VKJ06_04590 [Vampirovibrionales bacterium]|nr:hypothetical protein [Vampirovibrionales bacterium]
MALNPWVVVLSALPMGLTHALEPGHGKLLITTYLAAHRCRWFEILALAVFVVLFNLIGNSAVVFAGSWLLNVFKTLGPNANQWLNLVFGTLITLLGGVLLIQHWQNPYGACHHPHKAHPTQPELTPLPEPPAACPERPPHWWELASIGAISGIRPCPEGALIAVGLMAGWGITMALWFVLFLSVGTAAMVIGLGILITLGTKLFGWDQQHATFWKQASLWLSRFGFMVMILLGVWMIAQTLMGQSEPWFLLHSESPDAHHHL